MLKVHVNYFRMEEFQYLMSAGHEMREHTVPYYSSFKFCILYDAANEEALHVLNRVSSL